MGQRAKQIAQEGKEKAMSVATTWLCKYD